MSAVRNIALGWSVVFVGMLAGSPLYAQGPDLTAVEWQIDKLNAGQDALRKELQAAQRQLLEMRTLQQQPLAPPPKRLPPPVPAELVVRSADLQ